MINYVNHLSLNDKQDLVPGPTHALYTYNSSGNLQDAKANILYSATCNAIHWRMLCAQPHKIMKVEYLVII